MRRIIRWLVGGIAAGLAVGAWGADAGAVRERRLTEYCEFLSIPNVAADPAGLARNAQFILQMMRRRGVEGRLLDGETAATVPAVFGQVRVPGAKRTILFYAHYDGQPVNPAKWAAGLAPFSPVLIDAPMESGGRVLGPCSGQAAATSQRIAARGAADDRAGVMALLNAYEALVQSGRAPRANLKFLFEGEEEAGSPHLAGILRRHRATLASDLWVIVDGPRPAAGYPVVEFGVRGDVNVALTVYGPKRPLHSGNYGNWAPNPAQRLVSLLAAMKDDEGRIAIPHFNDDARPLTDAERQALAQVPDSAPALARELLISKPDGGGLPLAQLLTEPTININGISSGDVGAAASNQIPTRAEAVLDLRLAPGNSVAAQVAKIAEFARSRGYFVIDHEPSAEERASHDRLLRLVANDGYPAQRTRLDLPLAQSVVDAVARASGSTVVRVVSVGGSLPLSVIEQELQVPILTIPIVNYDNNQHAENENVRIDYLWSGIELLSEVLAIP
ncbi:MAG: M20/M25/M40 family metallo-hydrolase [Proteobacteria bacterium]|nr:M20/M25/M40 family metallo-hydrolase [Pseudomonadota bacterium]